MYLAVEDLSPLVPPSHFSNIRPLVFVQWISAREKPQILILTAFFHEHPTKTGREDHTAVAILLGIPFHFRIFRYGNKLHSSALTMIQDAIA